MQIVQIGPWEFDLPEGWIPKDREATHSYFEAPDGSKGLYAKVIELATPKATAADFAAYLQDVHLRIYTEDEDGDWHVVAERRSVYNGVARSALDIYDANTNYRVLSLVASTTESAIQVNVHDYWCEEYSVAQDEFESLELSIVRLASAA